MPEKTHPKTAVGSLCHIIFECLKNPRHKHHYDLICEEPFDVYRSEAISRLIDWNSRKLNIERYLLNDLNSMIEIGLKKIDFFHEKALERFAPEHKFIITLPSGATIKGFIDDMARYEDKFIIRDYKSQGKKFTKDELTNNIQAAIYQLYVWETFKMPAVVEFILLRHPATKRKPENHLQVVEPKNEYQFAGLKSYLDHMYGVVNNFGLSEAYSNFCENRGFCENVCQFKNPKFYQSVVDANGELVYNLDMDQKPDKLEDGQKVIVKQYLGCPKFNK